MQLFINNWATQLTAPALAGTGELSVELASAALLAGLGGGDFYRITLVEVDGAGVEIAWEIFKVTNAVGAVLTVEGAQEGTQPRDWSLGSPVRARVTAGFLDEVRDTPGPTGAEGASAYAVWLGLGNAGTEQDFIDSLTGPQGLDGPAGDDGASAYAVWLSLGNVGTEQDFIDALTGPQGLAGAAGDDGASAYAVWLGLGNAGTEQDFINSLTGPQGLDGPAGADGAGLNILGELATEGELPGTGSPGDAYVIAGDLWTWSGSAWINSGPIQGPEGQAGPAGDAGASAYAVWLGLGNAGTEQDFIDSLTGPQGQAGAAGNDGASAYAVWLGLGNAGTEQDFIGSLTGPQGPPGTAGADGADGSALAGLPSRPVAASGAVTPADAGLWLICTSATPITLTIGAEATAAWTTSGILPMFHILQVAAGAVTVTGDGFSVTLHTADTNVLAGAGAAATALWRASNTWSLIGRLVAA